MITGKLKRKIYKVLHPPIGEVFMLHRVVSERSILAANRQLEVTPEFLDRTIAGYINKGYALVSLDELEAILSSRNKINRPFVCFTLDDGYKDNYETAYPIFRKYHCPFTIYLTTDFPENKAILWWYILEDILKQNTALILGEGSRLKAETISEKDIIFDYIREKILAIDESDLVSLLKKIFVHYPFAFTDKVEELALSWEQVRDLAQDPLCTIGSHSVTHSVLTGLSAWQLVEELTISRLIIEHQIGKPVIHFAYPYGIYNSSVKEAVISTGYKTSVMVNGGKVRKEERSKFEIKRIQLEDSKGL